MRTRRTKLFPPSGLAQRVVDYATNGKYAGAYGNAWIECRGDRLYVRGYKCKQLQLATWRFKTRGRGHATALLGYLEALLTMGELSQTALFVESVSNERFANFLRRRAGWVEVAGPSFVYAAL